MRLNSASSPSSTSLESSAGNQVFGSMQVDSSECNHTDDRADSEDELRKTLATDEALSNGYFRSYPLAFSWQAFLYETAAHLIIARYVAGDDMFSQTSVAGGSGRIARNFRILLSSALEQLPKFIDRLLAESDRKKVESRAIRAKLIVDLAT
ncbi:unnamed protein product [Protopolystoma xenopodis]|uniref:Uncharacterized protein n=1 Tax=Protopolystoma xenopodis TaxID=117903 RepID=A0A3S5AU01_9PLAT|nr:unnamed protein product [Protopolystoma xenopodis]